jgi:tRNA (cytidine/uridine-2'-O-)-methyltransferase
MPLEIALYQPDIAANAGAIGRLCACFGLPLTVIEPAGFAFTDSSFRRAGMDYLEQLDLRRAPSWREFRQANAGRRMVLLTTKGSVQLTDFSFDPEDILLFGRESAGVPETVHAALPQRIRIPMRPGARSLNLAIAAGIVAAEALRQTSGFAGLG